MMVYEWICREHPKEQRKCSTGTGTEHDLWGPRFALGSPIVFSLLFLDACASFNQSHLAAALKHVNIQKNHQTP